MLPAGSTPGLGMSSAGSPAGHEPLHCMQHETSVTTAGQHSISAIDMLICLKAPWALKVRQTHSWKATAASLGAGQHLYAWLLGTLPPQNTWAQQGRVEVTGMAPSGNGCAWASAGSALAHGSCSQLLRVFCPRKKRRQRARPTLRTHARLPQETWWSGQVVRWCSAVPTYISTARARARCEPSARASQRRLVCSRRS